MYHGTMNPYMRMHPGLQGFGEVTFWSKFKGVAVGIAGGTAIGMIAKNFEDSVHNKFAKEAVAPAAASLTALILYGLVS